MPTIQANTTALYYEETGSGPETVVFSHGLLWSGKMFEQHIEGAELVFIPGAGHSSYIEEPDFVNNALQKFLSKQEAKNGSTHKVN